MLYYVCAFSASNELIIFVSTDCPFAKMTSYCWNPYLVLNLGPDVVLHSIIIMVANFLSIKIILHCFFGSSISSYLCLLRFERVVARKFLWFKSFSLCFSFNHNIPSLSSIVSMPFFHIIFCLYQRYLCSTEVSGFFLTHHSVKQYKRRLKT